MTDDDRIPASFVWTGDDGPDDMQKVPEGPALGNYPMGELNELQRQYNAQQRRWLDNPWPDRRTTMGEKLARFLNDLAEKVRGIH